MVNLSIHKLILGPDILSQARLGWEPWSSGYGRRLTLQRSWVQIPVPDTGWTWHFFTFNCCKTCIVCLKRPKINKKEVVVGPLKKRLSKHTFSEIFILSWINKIAEIMLFAIKSGVKYSYPFTSSTALHFWSSSAMTWMTEEGPPLIPNRSSSSMASKAAMAMPTAIFWWFEVDILM